VLEVKEISKSFGSFTALSAVSFHLVKGEVLGVIGPNGSGKTTLLESIVGLLPKDAGNVTLDGKELSPVEIKELVFYLPDGILPYEDQTVGETLHFFRSVFGSSEATVRFAVEGLELSSVTSKRNRELSKGFRKRVLLAIAFLAPQPCLFLDEPFDGFDLRQTQRMMELLKELKRRGKTLLLSIHQLIDAERMCERFLLLSQGTLVGEGNLSDLRSRVGKPNANLEEVFLALT
jgi:ABC-2 type transport system ATP-binding protein